MFKGLESQYITYLALGVIFLLFLFALIYWAGIHMYICLIIIIVLGVTFISILYHVSKRYGQYGLIRRRRARQHPLILRCRSRFFLVKLRKNED
ncbi:DUF4133 domain-containing protein [Fulvivirga ligni]|nr:DUF4133 domain-containing protein [Fulvivirga ligni]